MKKARTGMFTSTPLYDCKYDWPEDCFVQAGDKGLVLAPKGNYRTSFFEAFPRNPNTFIRGEGATMEEAEKKCWEKFQTQISCELDHTNPDNFERRHYRNGVGFCKKCKFMASYIFDPLENCHNCGRPTYYTYDIKNHWWCEDCKHLIPEEDKREYQKEMEEEENEAPVEA